MAQVKKTQILGPGGICSLVYLQPRGKKPALLSNGHWAVTGEPAIHMRAVVVATWGAALLSQVDEATFSKWELSESEFTQALAALCGGTCGCVYQTPDPIFEATFNPDERQHKLVFDQFFNLDAVEQLVRRPLTVLSGVTLSPRGRPEAYSWTYNYPTGTKLWVWAEYLPFFLRLGGVCLEYPVGSRAVLIKDAADRTIGALALYHP